MDFSSDELGRLTLPGIHDSQIVEFTLTAPTKTLSLRLQSAEGLATDIRTTSLQMLNVSGLWEGAIVSDLFVWDFRAVPENHIFDEDVGWRHLFEKRISNRDELDAQIERWKGRMQNGRLVSIACSYGGNISFLCEELIVKQGQV